MPKMVIWLPVRAPPCRNWVLPDRRWLVEVMTGSGAPVPTEEPRLGTRRAETTSWSEEISSMPCWPAGTTPSSKITVLRAAMVTLVRLEAFRALRAVCERLNEVDGEALVGCGGVGDAQLGGEIDAVQAEVRCWSDIDRASLGGGCEGQDKERPEAA